jgi:O-antigen/teichoic acid export membrane protein
MNEVKTHLSYSLKYLLALAIPFVFGAAILAKPVLSMFSTSEIAAEGYFVVPLVALGTLFMATYVVIAHILILVKRTKVIGAAWILCALINLGLNILVVPRIGILGAALSTLISYALALGITLYYSLKEIRFNIEWRFVLKSLIASIIMSLVTWKMDSAAISNVILTVSVGIVVYAAALVLLKGFKRGEWHFARELFQTDK